MEMDENEKMELDGGNIWKKIMEKIFKITDNGTLLDGIKGNTNIDCFIFGKQIF
jgi:hypothetical protein